MPLARSPSGAKIIRTRGKSDVRVFEQKRSCLRNVVLEASICQQSLSPAWSRCLQSDPALCRHSEWDFLGASLKMEAWRPVASTGCILGIVFLQVGQEGLVEGCGEAGRELKRCSEVSCKGQMRRETNNTENRKTNVLGNYGPTPPRLLLRRMGQAP